MHLFPEFPGFPGVLLPLAVQPVSLLLSLFQRLPLGLQLGQHVLKPNAVLAHLRLGVGDNFIGQAQPPRDGKGIGLAGDADQQPISRAEGLHIELAGGVLHSRRGHGKGFQLCVVGGGGSSGPQCPDVLNDGNGQRRTLHRVGTGSQLVEQDQTIPVRLL